MIDDPIIFWSWQTGHVTIDKGLVVTLDYPEFTAEGTESNIGVYVNNSSQIELQEVKLIFGDEKNFLRFVDGNEMIIEELSPGETNFYSLRFKTAIIVSENEIDTFMRVWYQDENSTDLMEGNVDHQNMPRIKLNSWYQRWVSFAYFFESMPDLLDGIVKGLGVLGTAVIGVLTLRGKLGELIHSLLPVLPKNNETKIQE